MEQQKQLRGRTKADQLGLEQSGSNDMRAGHCEECAYLKIERAAIHMDSHMPRRDAIKAASAERCRDHEHDGGRGA